MTAPDLTPITAAAAEATRWPTHGVHYADDDAWQCTCGWDASGKPDRADLYRLHIAEAAVAAVYPLIAAQVREDVARRIEALADSLPAPLTPTHIGYRHALLDAASIAREVSP